MRKLLIALATAASALAVAAPVSAQYYPQPQGYGYGYNNHGQARRLQARIDRLQGDLDRLAYRRVISRKEHRNLHAISHDIERRLRAAGRYGLDRRERYDIEMRIARLEQRIAHEVRDGRNGYRRGDYHGYGDGRSYDRDRDGRDDRYEDDRGRDHDRRRDRHDDDDDD